MGTARGNPADGSAGRNAELPVALGMANVGFYSASIGVVLVVLAEDLGVPAEHLSWLGSSFGYGLLVMALVGPALLRLGQRQVLTSAAVVLGVGSVLLAVVPGEAAAYAGALLQGLGAAGIVLVAPRLLHGPDAAIALTRANSVASVVAVAAPLVLGLAAATAVGARPALLLIVGAVVALVVSARRIESAPVTGAVAERSTAAWRTVLRRWLAVVCAVSVEFAFVVWGIARLTATGLDASLSAVVGASFQVGMALGRLVGPRLIARLPMVAVGSALAATGVIVVVVSTTWPLVGLGQLIAGLGIATLYPITLARLMATPGLRPELGTSLGALASGTAITVAPTALAGLALVVDLRMAFLVPLPILGLLLWLHREPRAAVR
ncbi:MAG: MFS transporter [Propionicimonas sp.]|uniref:MFS transporter n=1 Tax=Propionicimonas sp. TaxID=1955623 RepID=UPI003D0FA20C